MRKIISFVLVLLLVMGMNITVFADVTDPSVISNSDATTGPALETVTKGAADQSTEDGIKSDVTQNTQGLSGSLPIKKLDNVPDGYERIMASSGAGVTVQTNFCISDISAVDRAIYLSDNSYKPLMIELTKNDTTIIEVENDRSVEVSLLDIFFISDASSVTLSNINDNELEICPYGGDEGLDITIDGSLTLKGIDNNNMNPNNRIDFKLKGINNGELNLVNFSFGASPVNTTISDIVFNTTGMMVQAENQMTLSNCTFNSKLSFTAMLGGISANENRALIFNNCIFNLGGAHFFSGGKLIFNQCQGSMKYFANSDRYEYSCISAVDNIEFNMNRKEELRIEAVTDIGPFNDNNNNAMTNDRALTCYKDILLSNGIGVYSLEDLKLSIREIVLQPIEPPEGGGEAPSIPTSAKSATYSDGTAAESVVIKEVLGDDAGNKKDQPKTSDSSLLYIWIMGIIVSAFVLQEVFRKVYR